WRARGFGMDTFRIAPIFAVADLARAVLHYERLGFTTRVFEGGEYAFATRDDVELHLGVVHDTASHQGSAYLFVPDADELATTWRLAGVEVHEPVDTSWRMR